MNQRIKRIIEYGVGFVGSLIILGCASLPLFHAGLFPTIDNISVVRLESMSKALQEGQFPVRFSSDLARGHGYMLFNYYAPLPFYTGAGLHLVGVNLVGALKRSFFIALILATSGMFVLANEFFGPLGALVSVAAFVFSPFVGFDIYWRGGLGEVWAMSLVPWVLWSVYVAVKRNSSVYIILSGFFWSAVLLSHNITAYMAVVFVGIWAVAWVKYYRRTYWSIAGSIGIGLGLAAFFWAPVFIERWQVWVQYLQGNKDELFRSLVWGPPKEILFPTFIPMITNWSALVLPVISYLMIRKKITESSLHMAGLLCIGLFCLAAFFASGFSKFIWQIAFPILYIIQFPWRFFTMLSVFGSVLIGGFVLLSSKYKYVIAAIMVGIVIAVNFLNFRPKTYEFVDKYVAEDPCGTSWGFEYLPTTVKTCLKTPWDVPYKITSGSTQVISWKQKGTNGDLYTQSTMSAVINWGTYYTPGWQAKIDGKETIISPSYPYGLIEIAIPKGKHQIQFRLQPTQLEWVSNGVSVITLIGIVVYVIWCMTHEPKRAPKKRKK